MMQRVLGAMSSFADNIHTQVRRSGNPHTTVRGTIPPYDTTSFSVTVPFQGHWSKWRSRRRKSGDVKLNNYWSATAGFDRNICYDDARSNSKLFTFWPWPLTLRHIFVFSQFKLWVLNPLILLFQSSRLWSARTVRVSHQSFPVDSVFGHRHSCVDVLRTSSK